jgi:hypothetical protein
MLVKPTTLGFRFLASLVLLGLYFTLPPNLRADSISVTIQNTSVVTTPSSIVIFTGTITNDTAVSLNATDFFFNFFGFDPTLIVNQILGAQDFAIASGATSPIVDLFSVTLPAGSSTATFPISLSLEDVNGDLSSGRSVSVAVSQVPEPSSFLLAFVGLVLVLFLSLVLRARSIA